MATSRAARQVAAVGPQARVSRYLWSTKNLAGVLAALVGPVLFLTGQIGAVWPAVTVGLYGAGALLTPPGRVVQVREEGGTEDLQATLTEQVRRALPLLPPSSQLLLQSVQGHLALVLANLDRFTASVDPGTPAVRRVEDLLTVREIITQHLPSMLEDYLNLPPGYRLARNVTADLDRGLTAIDAASQRLEQAVLSGDVARVADQAAALERLFAPPSSAGRPGADTARQQ